MAGVAGLTTALLSLEKGHDVSIVARNLPGDLHPDYTSPFAGAHWSSLESPSSVIRDYDKPSYHKFLELARDPKSGISQGQQFKYSSDEDTDTKLPWYRDFVDDFRELREDELPEGTIAGYTYKRLVISTTDYLFFLLQKAVDLGGMYKRVNLKHINDVYKLHHTKTKPDFIINCSGLLARTLGGVEDSKMYPIRGQTILVRNFSPKLIYVEGFPSYPEETLYIMPRGEGGTTIGGCFQPRNNNKAVDYDMVERIKERALKYCPELVDSRYGNDSKLDTVRYNVAFRPGREGGPRLEVDLNNKSIVHNYGAASAGYQSSYGMSEKVVQMVEQMWVKSHL